MSIDQKIAELLDEAKKLQEQEVVEESTEIELDEAGAYEGEVKDALVHLKKKGLMDKSSKEMHAHLKYHGFSSGAAKNAVSIAAAKQGMKEEVVELPEEFANTTLEELEEFMVSEDFEQLDELSKSTLGSYIKKASQHRVRLAGAERDLDDKDTALQRAKHGADDATYDALSKAQDTMRKQRYKVSDKSQQRAQGISQAVKKLTKEEADYQVDMSEHVNALVEGEQLSEEFKAKAATIFEAAVVSRVKEEVAKLEEEFDSRLEEEVESIAEGLIEKVDGYLNYVVEQWISDNELALEHGMKNEIMESFISGMKGLFEQHYIDVPEEKYDVIGDLQEQIELVSSKLDEQLETNVALTKELNEMHRAAAINAFTADMVATDADKFNSLAEELAFDDLESFNNKLQVIKENYFGKKSTATLVESVVTNEPVELNEEVTVDPTMARYLRVFNGVNK